MRSQSLLHVLALVLPAACSFRAPPGITDGIYSINIDATGKDIWTLDANLTDVVPLPGQAQRQVRAAQDYPWADIHCYPNHRDVTPDDFRRAWQAMHDWCDNQKNTVWSHSKTFVSGNTMIYICNVGNGAPCSSVEFDHFNNDGIDRDCRPWMPGYAWIPDWKKTYGRDLTTEQFC